MCHPSVWARLILRRSGTELPATLPDTSEAVTFPPTSPYPILASPWGRERIILPGMSCPGL